ncbi:hypothetical protein SanaruYs_14890 [Chryseotalea sanaruensis]|uniref:Uncharacterized protein n=1 Tax=Chryseotalea sanaruensis TaxID=2482724 RepID=A0A401U8P0_9BACT|nr:hypothetical protein [Chryseotalea sanaruensis]GCC51268.1 hypothetical protein SanaruYs_14890 [Chryseotalea sanaruensis]
MIKEIFSQIPKKLASFSNDELYFIITELLVSNNLAKKLIVERSLYIKSSSNLMGEQLTFLHIDKSISSPNSQKSFTSFISVGRLDAMFSNIHLHTISFTEVERNCEIDIATIKVLLSGLVEPVVYQPANLIDGLLRIIKQPHFADRAENALFKIDLCENQYCHYFDLGIINNVDYSGMYYCIAKADKQVKEPSTVIIHYNDEELVTGVLPSAHISLKELFP